MRSVKCDSFGRAGKCAGEGGRGQHRDVAFDDFMCSGLNSIVNFGGKIQGLLGGLAGSRRGESVNCGAPFVLAPNIAGRVACAAFGASFTFFALASFEFFPALAAGWPLVRAASAFLSDDLASKNWRRDVVMLLYLSRQNIQNKIDTL